MNLHVEPFLELGIGQILRPRLWVGTPALKLILEDGGAVPPQYPFSSTFTCFLARRLISSLSTWATFGMRGSFQRGGLDDGIMAIPGLNCQLQGMPYYTTFFTRPITPPTSRTLMP